MPDLRGLLIRHEGMRLRPYLDTQGKITIGVGRNLEDVGITSDEALYLLEKDIVRAMAAAAVFSWYPKLDPVRKDVVVSMVFNLGLGKLTEFRRLIQAMERADYEAAANEMLASKWSAQVKGRAVELAAMMRTGQYQEG
jgi:lysozyme